MADPHIPLRFLLPSLLLVIGLTLTIGVAAILLRISLNRTDQLVSELVSVIGNTAAADIGAGLRNEDPPRVRASIEQLQSVRHLFISFLVDADGYIQRGSRRSLLGKRLQEISQPVLSELFVEALLNRGTTTRIVDEKLYYAQAINKNTAMRISNAADSYVLLLAYDFTRINASHRQTAINQSLLIATPVVVLSLLGWLLLNRLVLRRLNKLVSASQRIGAGDLKSSIGVGGRDEIGLLGGAFDQMRQDLDATRERTEQAIKTMNETVARLWQEERRMRLLIENLPEAIIYCDNDGKLRWFDLETRQWEETLPDTKQEDWPAIFGFHEKDGVTLMQYWDTPVWRAFQGEPIRNLEVCIKRGEKQSRFFNVNGGPILDYHCKQIGAVVVMNDITERKNAAEQIKRALKEKETLLKEVHHRVKNNLQIVSSLLDLQMSASVEPSTLGVLRDSVNRVRSMGMIHERLYRSLTLARIDFGEYADGLVHAIFSTFKIREHISLHVDVDPIELNIETAVPCGLILNELVSNACKHAFDGANKGEIRVTLSDFDNGEYRLVVQDSGPGLPTNFNIEKSDTLGLQLIVMLVKQIKGKLEVLNAGGAQFNLDFSELNIQSPSE